MRLIFLMIIKPKPGITWHTCANVLSNINHCNCNQGRTVTNMAKGSKKSGGSKMGGKGGKC